MLRALRPLVEDAECKAAVEAIGCQWQHCQDNEMPVYIKFPGLSIYENFATWPAARAMHSAPGWTGPRRWPS